MNKSSENGYMYHVHDNIKWTIDPHSVSDSIDDAAFNQIIHIYISTG